MIRRHYILPLFLSLLALCASAQTAVSDNATSTHTPFDLDLGLNVGTTGLGVTVSVPLGDMFNVRTGLDWTPRTNIPLKFELMSYMPGGESGSSMPEDTRFDRLSTLMEEFTGMKVDRYIDTHAKGTMVNFKLLVDFYPFRNNPTWKKWYLTAGFYWGASKVGHIENVIQEAPSMMGVLMYNKMYDFFANEKYLDEPLYEGFYVDPLMGDEMRDRFMQYGRVGAQNGRFKAGSPFAGTPYMMTPDIDGTVRADMYVNSFKPYIGIGWKAPISKDGKWNFAFDAGAMFWGRPEILTHERYIHDLQGNVVSYGTIDPNDVDKYVYGSRVDLANDVEGVVGKVGQYVDIARAVHVYPVLNFRLTYKLF